MMVSRGVGLLLALALSNSPAAGGAGGSRPHLVHVVMDDLGWGLVGFHDGSPEVETPTLDAVAADGLVLDRFYAHKICSPSRCALQTGRAPIHVNVQNLGPDVHNPEDPQGGYQGIPINMTTMAQHLRLANYTTRFVGKWDVGMATPAHHPSSRGFDSWLGYWHHANDYWSLVEGECADNTTAARAAFPSDPNVPVKDLWRFDAAHDGPAPALANSPACSARDQNTTGRCVFEESLFTSEVLDIVARHEPTTPLFLMWSMHLVHFPLEPPDSYEARYSDIDDPFRRKMAAMVYYMDQAIGQLLDQVRVRGMWDDTLVVLHSDNGGEIMFDGTCGGNNYPLRGGKFSNFEGGIRSVALVGGGALPAATRGTVSQDLVAIWDWYSTYAFLAGVDPTDHAAAAMGLPAVDSISAWPVLEGQGSARSEVEVGDTSAIYYNGDGDTLVGGLIWRDNRTAGKLVKVLVGAADMALRIPQDVTTGRIYPNGTFFSQLHVRRCGRTPERGCMFDIEQDPTETTNLATEPGFTGLFFAMLARIDELQQTVYSPVRGWRADPAACEQALGANDGFWGPWLPVPPSLVP